MSGWNWSFNSNNNTTSNSSNSKSNNSGFNWNSNNNNNNSSNNNTNNNSNSWSWNTKSNTNNNNNSNNNSWSWNTNSNSNNNSSGWNFNTATNNNNNNNNNSSSSWNWNTNNTNNNKNSNNNAWNFNTNNQNNNGNNYTVLYNANNPLSVIRKLVSEYLPAEDNPNCRFETILYNKVPKQRMISFEKPPFVRAVVWDKFVANNPDPHNLVPVAVRGYSALHDRSKLCLAGHVSATKSYSEVMDKINELKYNIDKKMRDQILELKQIQIRLSHRLLVILKTYVLMSVQQEHIQQGNRSHARNNREVMSMPRLNPDENRMKKNLDALMKQTRSLYFRMSNVDKSIQHVSMEPGYEQKRMDIQRNVVHEDSGMFVDPNNKKAIFNFLHDQTKILSQLSKTVQKDMDDLNIIENGIKSAYSRVML
eukprot:206878_1